MKNPSNTRHGDPVGVKEDPMDMLMPASYGWQASLRRQKELLGMLVEVDHCMADIGRKAAGGICRRLDAIEQRLLKMGRGK